MKLYGDLLLDENLQQAKNFRKDFIYLMSFSVSSFRRAAFMLQTACVYLLHEFIRGISKK